MRNVFVLLLALVAPVARCFLLVPGGVVSPRASLRLRLMVEPTQPSAGIGTNPVGPDLRKTDSKTVSSDMLDEAKGEEEQAFEAALRAAAAAALAPESIAARRSASEAALAELRAAVDADDSHPVAKAMAARGKAAPTGKLKKALTKPKGTMALVGESVPMDDKHISFGGFDLEDPVYLSTQFRVSVRP